MRCGAVRVTAPKRFYQAEVFHELNTRKIELLQDFFAFLLHPSWIWLPGFGTPWVSASPSSKSTARTPPEYNFSADLVNLFGVTCPP